MHVSDPRRLDRTRDLAGWVLTPLVTLVLGPAVAAAVGVLTIVSDDLDEAPGLCATTSVLNRCEETTLAMLGVHAALFALLWLLLWLTPWWRGLRLARIVLAGLACVVLLIAPLRMS